MKNILLLIILLTTNLFAEEKIKILFLGDSLTEGYGIDSKNAYPSVVKDMLEKAKQESIGHTHVESKEYYKIYNGGISGATTSSGLSKLNWFLKEKPHVLVLALGANDGMRAIDTKVTHNNLEKIILKAKENNMKVLLVGMKIPTNYGEKYRMAFEKIYLDLKNKFNVEFVPFLLDKVGGQKELNQADGIHPNEKGHKILAETLYPYLEKLL